MYFCASWGFSPPHSYNCSSPETKRKALRRASSGCDPPISPNFGNALRPKLGEIGGSGVPGGGGWFRSSCLRLSLLGMRPALHLLLFARLRPCVLFPGRAAPAGIFLGSGVLFPAFTCLVVTGGAALCWSLVCSGGASFGGGWRRLSFCSSGRCAVSSSLSLVSVVSVRGVAAGSSSVSGVPLVYLGRRCAGWSGSPLGNPFRPVGGVPGSSLPAFRSWLWSSVVRPGLAGVSSPGWVVLVGLARSVAAGRPVALGCWCASPSCCHASVVRSCVLWLVSSGVWPRGRGAGVVSGWGRVGCGRPGPFFCGRRQRQGCGPMWRVHRIGHLHVTGSGAPPPTITVAARFLRSSPPRRFWPFCVSPPPRQDLCSPPPVARRGVGAAVGQKTAFCPPLPLPRLASSSQGDVLRLPTPSCPPHAPRNSKLAP